MRMIDVLNLMVEGKIEDGTELVVIDGYGERYKYKCMSLNGGAIINNDYKTPKMAKRYPLARNFLNLEVELIDET